MFNVVVHIDGSSIKGAHSGSSRKWSMGYGIVVSKDGQTVELSGSRHSPKGYSGSHEFYAFIEAALYLKSAGIPFNEVSLFTDDQQLALAHFAFHPENYMRSTAFSLMDQFHKIMMAYGYSQSDFVSVMDALSLCHIRKIKGHSGLVYSERVDYLAKTSAQRLSCGSDSLPMLSFNEWLKRGVIYYCNGGFAKFWHAAFCSPESEMSIV